MSVVSANIVFQREINDPKFGRAFLFLAQNVELSDEKSALSMAFGMSIPVTDLPATCEYTIIKQLKPWIKQQHSAFFVVMDYSVFPGIIAYIDTISVDDIGDQFSKDLERGHSAMEKWVKNPTDNLEGIHYIVVNVSKSFTGLKVMKY